MDALKELSQHIHLQPYKMPRGSIVTLGPALQLQGRQLTRVRCSVGLLSQGSGGRTSEAKGGQDWVLLRPLSSRFLSVSYLASSLSSHSGVSPFLPRS